MRTKTPSEISHENKRMLELSKQGLDNVTIAERLGLARQTVTRRLKALMAKEGAA